MEIKAQASEDVVDWIKLPRDLAGEPPSKEDAESRLRYVTTSARGRQCQAASNRQQTDRLAAGVK